MFWSADLYRNQENIINNNHDDDDTSPPTSWFHKTCTCLLKFYNQYEFLILVVCAILIAKAYPPLGAVHLAPQITATWIAVILIFLLAGLGLKTEEFSKALLEWKFNAVVQTYNFFVDSAVVYGVSRLLVATNALQPASADGLVVCASLSMTINMVIVLTSSSGGNEASAIFNSAAGNMIGILLTPVLILGYLGRAGGAAGIDVGEVFYKLALRVVLPLGVGQLVRKFVPSVVEFYKTHKKWFKKIQQYLLVYLVYTVFCRTFYNNNNNATSAVDIVIVIAVVFACLVSLMVGAWVLLKILFPTRPDLRVMGLYGCTHKTVAMGVPMINALYDDDATVGLVTLPLLVWHTSQLIIGSFLAPKLSKWVDSEQERLGIIQKDDDDVDDDDGRGDVESNTNDTQAAAVVVAPVGDSNENDDKETTENVEGRDVVAAAVTITTTTTTTTTAEVEEV